jgi:DNA-binding transcriptional regulator YhcF (GntR family)
MQKALVELEELNLIYTERTNGKYITEDTNLIKKHKENYAKELSKEYFTSMKTIGFNEEETIKYLKELGGNK